MKLSPTSLKVIHAASVATVTEGLPDGQGADMEDVRDLLVARFGMTKAEAEAAIQTARDEGVIDLGDPQP
jgi:hypothetical protein